MNTAQVGLIGEARIVYEATKRGYSVARPLSNSLPYDLIIERNGVFERVQIKTLHSNGSVIYVNTHSMRRHEDGKKKYVYYAKEDFEWLAIVDITTDSCFYVPSREMTSGRLSIRLTSPHNNGKPIKWAKDYTNW
jgi:hypothetical protein